MFGGYPPTAIGYPPTAIGYTPTAIGYPPAAISYPPAAIIGRIGHSEFFFIFIMATPAAHASRRNRKGVFVWGGGRGGGWMRSRALHNLLLVCGDVIPTQCSVYVYVQSLPATRCRWWRALLVGIRPPDLRPAACPVLQGPADLGPPGCGLLSHVVADVTDQWWLVTRPPLPCCCPGAAT